MRESEVAVSADSEEIFAVCLETGDAESLIPFKIYRIVPHGEYARVIDEKGKPAVYPSRFFLPLQLPAEITDALTTAYAHIA